MLGSNPRGLTVGEFARRIGARTRTVEWWVERGFLNAEGVGRGPGSRRTIPTSEIAIASRVVEYTVKLGVKATPKLFEVVRAQAA